MTKPSASHNALVFFLLSQGKSPEDKAASRLADTLLRLHGGPPAAASRFVGTTDPKTGKRSAASAGAGSGLDGGLNADGRMEESGDSVELMLGNTTDGGVGLGWQVRASVERAGAEEGVWRFVVHQLVAQLAAMVALAGAVPYHEEWLAACVGSAVGC